MKTEVTKISRENLEVVISKVTYHLDDKEWNEFDVEGRVKFKLLDKATQNTLFEGSYIVEQYMTDIDDIFELYLENNGIEGEWDDEKIQARYYKKALEEYKETLVDNFWHGTDVAAAEGIKDFFIKTWDDEDVYGYYFTGNKRKTVHYVFY